MVLNNGKIYIRESVINAAWVEQDEHFECGVIVVFNGIDRPCCVAKCENMEEAIGIISQIIEKKGNADLYGALGQFCGSVCGWKSPNTVSMWNANSTSGSIPK